MKQDCLVALSGLALATALQAADVPTSWLLASGETECRIKIVENRPVLEHVGIVGETANRLGAPVPVALADNSRPWKYEQGVRDEATGTLRLEFACSELRYRQFLQARPGPGPIRLWAEVENLSTNNVNVTVPPSLKLRVLAAGGSVWWVKRGGNDANRQGGTFTEPVSNEFNRQFGVGPGGDKPVPWMAVQAEKHGLYIGWEYSGNGTMNAVAADTALDCGFKLAEARLPVPAKRTLWIPPAFVGCYKGDVDDGSYSLHRFYLEKLRPPMPKNCPDPLLTYNVFFGGDKEPGLMAHMKLAQEFGFEAFVPDAIWFPGAWQSYAGPWIWDSNRFPNGAKPYQDFCKTHGMKFGLWCAWGRNNEQAEQITRQIVATNSLNYFKHDMGLIPGGSYARTLLYYRVQESLRRSFPDLILENCDAGGCIKDFGAMSRAHYIVCNDVLSALPNRMSIYDSTFVLPPRVLQAYTWLQHNKPGPYLWRSAIMAAWVIDVPPLGGADAESVKKAVAVYKNWIRPILQDCKVHHILPRPDGKRWDGMFYWGPRLKQGILFIFRPQSREGSQTVKLKGLEPSKRYKVWSEDGSIAAAELTGQELMATGLAIKLPSPNSSDLILVEEKK